MSRSGIKDSSLGNYLHSVLSSQNSQSPNVLSLNHLAMKLIAALTFVACFAQVSAKSIDINQVLRIQMEQLVHQYNTQKMTGHHTLKDKATRNSIKKELMSQFQKMAHATEHRLGKRAKAMKMAQKQRKRNRKLRA